MIWRRVLAAATGAGGLWLLAVWPPPVWWRTHWPARTAMMRWVERRAPSPAFATPPPLSLAVVAPALQRVVIIAEDSRFHSHWGIDPAEIAAAVGIRPSSGPREVLAALWRRRHRLRGASTITQQLAKNLYLSPTRNPLRKVKEIATALRLEAALSKDRILELYLGTVELGPGVWGVEAASQHYFGVAASAVSVTQAAALAATLPHPRSSNPTHRPDRMLARRDLILARYYGRDVVLPPVDELDPEFNLDSFPIFVPPRVSPGLDTVTLTVPIAPPLDSPAAPRR